MTVPNRNVGSRIRRVLFWVGGNVLLFTLTWAFIAVVGEVWLRLQRPFLHKSRPMHFVPKVGWMIRPNTEVRATNRLDFWTVSRTNSDGFLDREPIVPERTAASCHIALIGDSFVEAGEVPIADKLHVRLEALAARVLPELDVTTSAFGITGTGQINQLPLYDEFARRLRPKLVVLVFVSNDFADNTSVLKSLLHRRDPDRMPWVSARRDAEGRMKLLPPAPDGWRPLPGTEGPPYNPVTHVLKASSRHYYFAGWLDAKLSKLGVLYTYDIAERLRRRPGYESLLGGWQPTPGQRIDLTFNWQPTPEQHAALTFNQKDLPPFFEAALDFTAFGLDQFKQRADRDGASLVILSTHTMGTRGNPAFNRMYALASARGIPVIDEYDYIRRQGAEIKDAHWRHDPHWNAAGHQWVAEALLKYLKRNPAICAQRPGVRGEEGGQ